jgi:hypothetical protein
MPRTQKLEGKPRGASEEIVPGRVRRKGSVLTGSGFEDEADVYIYEEEAEELRRRFGVPI